MAKKVKRTTDRIEDLSSDMRAPRTETEKEARKREILDNLNSMQDDVNKSFDSAKKKVVRAMPNMGERQQDDLAESVTVLGTFVTRLMRLIDDIIDRVLNFFRRTLDRIVDTFRDFQATFRGCIDSLKSWWRELKR